MTAPTARSALDRVGILANDTSARRWSLHTRFRWYNDGRREMALLKPSTFTTTAVLSLVSGSRQSLPALTNQLIRASRNVASAGPSPLGLESIIMVAKADMDGQVPSWGDMSVFAAQKRVIHVMVDESDPLAYWCWPPNNGTGRIEAIVAQTPDTIPTPSPSNQIASYESVVIDFDPIYFNAIVDYMLFKMYAEDAQQQENAARAAAHYQLFANALGVKLANEMGRSPNRPSPRPETAVS